MLTRLSTWLYTVSTGRVALAGLLIFAIFSALVLPGQAASAEEKSGGAGSPDTSFVYSADDLYRMAEAYGQQGRDAYVRARWTFDVAFPLVYTLFLITTISWLLARLLAPGSAWRLTNLIPLLGMLFDFAENTCTSLVMLRYPDKTPVIAMLAPIFTAVKWGLIAASAVLLIVGVVGVLWRRAGKG